MKDYKQVTDSVFKKAEQRIAEKKRRAAIIKRNAIAASGMAAALFIVLLQNDDIRSALRSLPKLASSGWSDHGSKSSHTTTAEVTTELTTTQKSTTTKATTSSSETTSTETTSTETTTTTTTAKRTEAPVTEAEIEETTVQPTTAPPPEPSKIEGKQTMYLCNTHSTVIHASSNRLELDYGITIGLEYGFENYLNKFKVGDEICYNAYFAYNEIEDIYYYTYGYIDYQDEEKFTTVINDVDLPYIDAEPYEEYYGCQSYLFGNAPFADYNTVMTYPYFCFKDEVYYRIEARKIKLIDVDGSRVTAEDGQEWQLNSFLCDPPDVNIYSLKPGDIISLAGDFAYDDYDNVLRAISFAIKIE